MDACATTNHQVVALELRYEGTPSVKIYGDRQRSLQRKEWLELTSSAYVTSCDGTEEIKIDDIFFQWTVKKDNIVIPTITSEANDPRLFRLSPYSLDSESSYTISVTCSRTGIDYVSSSSVSVYTVLGHIHSQINLGSDFSIRKDSISKMDGSYSYDDNYSQNSESFTGHLSYYWTLNCYEVDKIDVNDCSGLKLPPNYQSNPVFNVEALKAGDYIFVLVVRDLSTDRYDTSSVTLTVLPDAYPSVHFPMNSLSDLDLSTRLQLEAIGTISKYATYQWSSEPSLKDGSLDSPRRYPLSVKKETQVSIPLRLDTNVLFPHTEYTFTVLVGYNSGEESRASILVITNGPPTMGKVLVNPLTGNELITKYDFTSIGWEDADLPITHSYGLLIGQRQQMLQTRSEDHNGSFYFPAGEELKNFELRYFCDIIDGLGLNTTSTGTLVVEPLMDLG